MQPSTPTQSYQESYQLPPFQGSVAAPFASFIPPTAPHGNNTLSVMAPAPVSPCITAADNVLYNSQGPQTYGVYTSGAYIGSQYTTSVQENTPGFDGQTMERIEDSIDGMNSSDESAGQAWMT
jgi:hypothetical protein